MTAREETIVLDKTGEAYCDIPCASHGRWDWPVRAAQESEIGDAVIRICRCATRPECRTRGVLPDVSAEDRLQFRRAGYRIFACARSGPETDRVATIALKAVIPRTGRLREFGRSGFDDAKEEEQKRCPANHLQTRMLVHDTWPSSSGGIFNDVLVGRPIREAVRLRASMRLDATFAECGA